MNGIAPIFRRDGGLVRLVRLVAVAPVAPVRKRGGWKGRPHDGRAVLAVRELVETTTCSYAEIEARTGVGRASICRWRQDGGWLRSAGAPVATDTVPGERASARLRARTLHRRAQDVAERWLDELERLPEIDLTALNTVLEMLKAAKLARRPKRRGRRAGADGSPAAAAETAALAGIAPRRRAGRLPSPHLPEVRRRAWKRDP